jgi:nicotinamide riboside kinase
MDGLSPFKLAFIGSHGVGKTTLAFGLAARLKARDVSLDVVHEVARRCPLPINESTSVAAQSWILTTQVAEEVVASARYPVVLCDRSVLDNYVYMVLAAGEREPFDTLVARWLETYQLLVHVPITGRLLPDGIRAPDPAFQRLVEERLDRQLERRALAPLRLDPEGREGWVDAVEDAVWRHLRPAQLELL